MPRFADQLVVELWGAGRPIFPQLSLTGQRERYDHHLSFTRNVVKSMDSEF